MKEPIVILWHARRSEIECADRCFKRLRLHYPGVLVILIGDSGIGMDFPYVDGRCRLYHRAVESQLDVWKLFSTDHVFFDGYPSAILWPSNLYIGAKPLGPCLGDKFFFVSSSLSGLNYASEIEIDRDLRWPVTFGLSGYIQRRTLQQIDLSRTLLDRSFVYQLVSIHSIGYEYKEDSFDPFVGEQSLDYVKMLDSINAPIVKILIKS